MSAFPIPITALSAVLNKRQITTDEATKIELKICTKAEAEDELGMRVYGQVETCERLPYFGLRGEYLDFSRYRINYKKGDESFEVEPGKMKARPKYLNRHGKIQQGYVYLPRVGGLDWENIAYNTSEPLMITEGEYKAIAACQRGIPCIGLPGIWYWGSKSSKLYHPLDMVNWIDKNVWICFDADDESSEDIPLKWQVAKAAKALAEKLYKLGAKPRLLYIAKTPTFKKARVKDPSVKMGLDDFLQAGGGPDELFETAKDPVDCKHLAALNSQYAVCQGLAGVGVMDTRLGKLYKVNDFKTVEMPRIRKSHNAKGGVTKIYVTQEFLEQEDGPVIKEIVFEPSLSPGYDREQAIFNEWGGWPMLELSVSVEAEQQAHIIGTWRKLIVKLFGEHANYFEQWAAHMIQQPGVKTSIGVLIYSVLNGVGKSLLGEVLRELVGDKYGKACELQRVGSNFNSILDKCLFLQMDEANGLQDGLEGKLNDLITSNKTTIERKGHDSYTVNNYMRCFMTTNSTRPIRLNEHNRRWLVIRAGVTEGELLTWAPWCSVAAKELKSTAGLWALRQHLEGISLVDWDPTARVPVTEAMEDMVESSRSHSGVLLVELLKQARSDWADGKLWLVTTATSGTGTGAKVWGDLRAHVKDAGGRMLRHTFRAKYDQKHDGRHPLTAGYILDFESCLPAKQNNDKTLILDTAGDLTRFDREWSAAALRATQAWNEGNRHVKGDDGYR